MKSKIVDKKNVAFKPVTLEVTLETKQELELFNQLCESGEDVVDALLVDDREEAVLKGMLQDLYGTLPLITSE